MDLMKKQISYNYLFRIILVDLHQNLLSFMAQLVLGSLLFSVRLGSNHFHITSKYFVHDNIKYTKNVNIQIYMALYLRSLHFRTAQMSLKDWLAPAVPLLICRFCGTTPNSTALGQ